MSDMSQNVPLIKRGRGRPRGATKEKFPMLARLKLLKSFAIDTKLEARIRLASVDLYSKLAGDAIKPMPSTLSGTVLGFDFTTTSPINTPSTPIKQAGNTNSTLSTAPVKIVEPTDTPGKPWIAISNTPVTSPINTPIQSNNDLLIQPKVEKETMLEELCREVVDVDFFKEEENLFDAEKGKR